MKLPPSPTDRMNNAEFLDYMDQPILHCPLELRRLNALMGEEGLVRMWDNFLTKNPLQGYRQVEIDPHAIRSATQVARERLGIYRRP